MRNFCFILIWTICFSCESQKSQITTVKGDWYPIYEKGYFEEYFEMFVDDEKIYYYAPTGSFPMKRYKIEGEFLFIENLTTNELEKKGKFRLDKDSLIIENFEDKIVFLKVNSNSNSKLSKVVKGTLNEEKYYKNFSERMFQWIDQYIPE